jgi:hypothetical protein
MLFLAASLGWCIWSWQSERLKNMALKRGIWLGADSDESPIASETQCKPPSVTPIHSRESANSKVYRFPMHQLARNELKRAEAGE